MSAPDSTIKHVVLKPPSATNNPFYEPDAARAPHPEAEPKPTPGQDEPGTYHLHQTTQGLRKHSHNQGQRPHWHLWLTQYHEFGAATVQEFGLSYPEH